MKHVMNSSFCENHRLSELEVSQTPCSSATWRMNELAASRNAGAAADLRQESRPPKSYSGRQLHSQCNHIIWWFNPNNRGLSHFFFPQRWPMWKFQRLYSLDILFSCQISQIINRLGGWKETGVLLFVCSLLNHLACVNGTFFFPLAFSNWLS